MIYPLKNLKEFMNTVEEWHNVIIGLCLPVLKLWRVKTIPVDRAEYHYFAGGVLVSTIAIAAGIALLWRHHVGSKKID